MRQLCLSLKKEWYGLIQIGRKTEEYREIKPYWVKRLFVHADGRRLTNSEAFIFAQDIYALFRAVGRGAIEHILYTHVKFSYGYTKRTMTFEVKDIRVGRGRVEWGAPLVDVIIIKLGKKIESSNED
mgnify:CR=1 FL=1